MRKTYSDKKEFEEDVFVEGFNSGSTNGEITKSW
jgi:hypothetical protein